MPIKNVFSDQMSLESRHGAPSALTRQLYHAFQEAPWMNYAYAELGQQRVAGAKNNPRIVEYLQTCGYSAQITPAASGGPDLTSENTSWCSAFVNWCMEQVGYKGTQNTMAKSWSFWELAQEIKVPITGCIVVMNPHHGTNTSTTSTNGHVCFYWRKVHGVDEFLGGNQGKGLSRVSIQPLANTIVGYYWPMKLITTTIPI